MNPKYECRVCKDATECTKVWKDENEEFMNCSAFVAPPPTNADSIMAMSDEDLAKFIEEACCPPVCYTKHVYECQKEDCVPCWLAWLKEEVKG